MKKRILAIMAALMLSLLSIFYPYAEARAAALPSLTYTAVPLVYEFISSMMVAQGIGDSNYWNSKSSSDKSRIEEDFNSYYSQFNLTDEEKKLFSYYNKLQAANGYVIVPISAGQFRVSSTIMDIAAKFADGQGWLTADGGEIGTDFEYTDTQVYQVGDSYPATVDNRSYLEFIHAYINQNSTHTRPTFSNLIQEWDLFEDFFNSQLILYNYIHIRYNGNNMTIWCANVGSEIKKITYPTFAYAPNPIAEYWFNVSDEYNTGKSFNYNVLDGTFTSGNSGNVICYQYNKDAYADGDWHTSNIGDWTIQQGDYVPSGEIGKTNIDNGTVELPYENGQHENIDNYGDTVPMTLPDNLAKDLVIWQGAIENAADAVVQGVEAIKQQALPIDYTQAVAQAGEVAIDEPFSTTSDILPNIPALTIPSFITERFPFCIPFDLVRLIKRFNSSGTTAPVFDVETPFMGTTLHMHIDFSMFDDLARLVRIGVLALSAIGIMRITVDVIKW